MIKEKKQKKKRKIKERKETKKIINKELFHLKYC